MVKLRAQSLKGKDQLAYLDVDGRIILKSISNKTGFQSADWGHLVQDRVQNGLKMIMNVRVPQIENFTS
jgi:hypothetical protein